MLSPQDLAEPLVGLQPPENAKQYKTETLPAVAIGSITELIELHFLDCSWLNPYNPLGAIIFHRVIRSSGIV